MAAKWATLTRRASFSAGHRYHNPQWSDEKNREVFGKCNLPNGHGHNYVLEVSVTGEIHPETGMVINLVDLDKVLHEVIEPLDHRFLNLDIEAFSTQIPTTENVALYLSNQLAGRLSECKLSRVRLYEDPTLWAEVTF